MEIQEFFKTFKKIAVVGLSPKEERASYKVAKYLLDHGFEVVGVRPGGGEILGVPVYESIADLPEDIEVIDVFRASDHVPPIAEATIAKGAKVLWLQEGVTHKESEEKAKQAGLLVFSDVCIKKEHEKL